MNSVMNSVKSFFSFLFSPFSKLIENVRIALSSLTANKLRAFLTVIGIGVGIAAVIILVTLGDSVRSYVNAQFLTTGADLVTVRAGGGFGFAEVQRGVSRASITDKDFDLLSDPEALANVKTVLPTLSLNRLVEYGTGQQNTSVIATLPAYFDLLSRTIGTGRLFDDNDQDTAARVAVLGQTTVSNLFPTDVDPLGETIRIGGVNFRVIGVLASAGNSAGGFGNQDNLVAIPLSTARTYLDTTSTVGGAKPLSQIYLKVTNSNADTINGVVAAATDLLKTAHKIKPNARNDFNVSTSLTIVSSIDSVISALTVFLAVIGGISLVVGGVGVMNIMLVTVTERTREIGLRKAVGARNWDVLSQFLTESVMLCFIGGFAGLMLAYGVLGLVHLAVSQIDPVINLTSIVVAIGVTCLIGIFFGIYPANRAASLTPLQALRFE